MAGFKIAEIFAELGVRDKGFKAGLRSARASLRGFGSAISGGMRILSRAMLVGGAAMAGVTALAIRQERAETRLAAVLRSTGNAAGFSAEQMKEQARQLQAVTTHGDEAVMEVQALLSTFTSLRGTQFKDATEMVLDLSEAMGGDLRMASIQLGKALNDPTKGLTALTRSGVSFNEEETKMIKGLVKAKKVTEAQVLMLKIMKEQGLGGVARAMRGTFGGALKATANELGDFGETVGDMFKNDLLAFAKGIRGEVIPALTDLQGGFEGSGDAGSLLADSLAESIRLIKDLKDLDVGGTTLGQSSGFFEGLGGGIASRAIEARGAAREMERPGFVSQGVADEILRDIKSGIDTGNRQRELGRRDT